MHTMQHESQFRCGECNTSHKLNIVNATQVTKLDVVNDISITRGQYGIISPGQMSVD